MIPFCDSVTLHQWLWDPAASDERRQGAFGQQIGERVAVTPGQRVSLPGPSELQQVYGVLWKGDDAVYYFDPQWAGPGDTYDVSLERDVITIR